MPRLAAKQAGRGAAACGTHTPVDFEPAPPSRDADLLFRCMDLLQIDRGKLAGDDPLLFYELQGVCTLCRSKDDCMRQLGGGFAEVEWHRWWLFCPNSAVLTTLGAVQHCGGAASDVAARRWSTWSHLG